ncbi:MAG: type I glyceraldehyde-3-phosphate dehydrogenase [Chloroflexota bacterium]|nr:type I glyceraldehyde-3-phosphate dehydrogenase [Chloroflexota bacterium]
MAVRVAINGLGRIGRAAFKLILETPELELVAVNDIGGIENMAYLLKYDTVYGRYDKRVEVGEGNLVVEGKPIAFLSVKDPAQLPWGSMGVELVFECTGIFTKQEDAAKHIQAGSKWVIISGPTSSEDVPTVVHGVNRPDQSKTILSCASCTTNNITPIMEIMDRHFGVEKAIMTTVHAYTATQMLVDSPGGKKDMRRGRAAAANFVPSTTGAAIATAKALPQLNGKFDGISVRGPVAVGSIADIVLVLKRDTTVEEVNEVLAGEAASPRYKGVLAVTDEELVSSDIIKDPHASIVQLDLTKVVAGNLVKIMSWYDNEWGFTNQMISTALHSLGLREYAF